MAAAQENVKPIIKEVFINAPLEKVWKAITDKEQMKQWYFDLSEFKPEVGFQFKFSGQGHKGEKYLHLCTITEVVPLQRLQYSWRYEGYEGDSLVTFELYEEKGGTRLRLTHEGLETFPQHNADFAPSSFNEGWTYLIEKSVKEFMEGAN